MFAPLFKTEPLEASQLSGLPDEVVSIDNDVHMCLKPLQFMMDL